MGRERNAMQQKTEISDSLKTEKINIHVQFILCSALYKLYLRNTSPT